MIMRTIKQIIREEIDNSLGWLNDIEPNQEDIMKFIGWEKPEQWRFGKHWEGDLNLSNSSIKDLGDLETVSGGLNLFNTPITNLGNLESVGRYLFLKKTPIASFGNLKSVDGYLNLNNTPLSRKYTEWEIRKQVNIGGVIYF